jgi:hypothetical protein
MNRKVLWCAVAATWLAAPGTWAAEEGASKGDSAAARPARRPPAVTKQSLPAEIEKAKAALRAAGPVPADIPPATLQALRAKSLGYNLQDDNLGLWEAAARADDLAKVGPLGYSAAELATKGYIAVEFPREGGRMPQPSAALLAKAKALTLAESLEADALSEKAREIHARGKQLAVAPTGALLLAWGPEKVSQLARQADLFVIQAERWLVEDESADKRDFTEKVLTFSRAIRQGNPKCRIFIEVGRRIDRGGGTADHWLHALALLYAKDPNSFDGIYPFISRQPSEDPHQGIGALRQMLAWLRPLPSATSGPAPAPAGAPALKEPPPAADRPQPSSRIRAQHYEALKAVIRPGDVIYVSCTRGPGGMPGRTAALPNQPAAAPADLKPVFNKLKFAAALEALNAVKDPRVGKSMVLSSVEDLIEHRDELPKDLTWVEYNSEPGMTAAGEIADIEKSVARFAEVAHKAGWKAGWAPTHVMLRASDDTLLRLVKYVDGIGLQHQKVLQFEGVDAMIRLTEARCAAVRKVNPQCKIIVQVVIGRGANEELIRGLRGILPVVDAFGVFTMRDTDNALAILRAVRGD